MVLMFLHYCNRQINRNDSLAFIFSLISFCRFLGRLPIGTINIAVFIMRLAGMDSLVDWRSALPPRFPPRETKTQTNFPRFEHRTRDCFLFQLVLCAFFTCWWNTQASSPLIVQFSLLSQSMKFIKILLNKINHSERYSKIQTKRMYNFLI